MQKFVIDGGTALSGTVVPAGNKNGALPILAASLLTEDEVVVRNVPELCRYRRSSEKSFGPGAARSRAMVRPT